MNCYLILFVIIIILVVIIIASNKKYIINGGFDDHIVEYMEYNKDTYNTFFSECFSFYDQIDKDIRLCERNYMNLLSTIKYKDVDTIEEIFTFIKNV